MPSVAKDRKTAPFYCVDNGATVMVKKGRFFRDQGGLKQSWGRHRVGIQASTLGAARRYAAAHVFGRKLSSLYANEK